MSCSARMLVLSSDWLVVQTVHEVFDGESGRCPEHGPARFCTSHGDDSIKEHGREEMGRDEAQAWFPVPRTKPAEAV